MQVGDLVQLSAYAKNLKGWYNGRDEDVGLVVSKRWDSLYVVVWTSDGRKQINVDRRDLKYAKNKTRRLGDS